MEGLLWRGNPRGEAAVLCHPHPQFGGDMHNNVVTTMTTFFQEQGISTLRFNFRGAGMSEGRFGGGVEERLDVEAAIDALVSSLGSKWIHVCGYSFGAHVGSYVASVDDRVDGLVGVAPPLVVYDFDFLKDCSKRKLIIAGADDPFCPPGRLRDWFDSLKEPKALEVIPQTDHFFSGREILLKEALRASFSSMSQSGV